MSCSFRIADLIVTMTRVYGTCEIVSFYSEIRYKTDFSLSRWPNVNHEVKSSEKNEDEFFYMKVYLDLVSVLPEENDETEKDE